MTTINTPADTAIAIANAIGDIPDAYTTKEVWACARTLHLLAWASAYEEAGGEFSPGTNIDDVAPPTTLAAFALAGVVVRAASAADVHANAADLAHHSVGSGGSNTDFRPFTGLWTGEFNYYVGDDGAVWAFTSPVPQGNGRPAPDACNGKVAETAEDFDLPAQVQVEVCVTYEVITDDSAAEGDAAERGFIVDGNDLPDPGIVGPIHDNWRVDNEVGTTMLLPRDAEALRELARGRTVSVRSETVVEADGVQSTEDGSWRSETLHVDIGGDLDADDVKAWTAVVRKALRLR